jgi:Ca2+-binding RTX toxin-like protein
MPSQVGKTEGSKPLNHTASEGVQDVNSTQVEKQTPQKQKDTSKSETSPPRQASVKEKGAKKGEVAEGANYQQRKLNEQLIRGTKGDDNIHISKADGLLGQLGLYEIDVNGKKQFVTKEQLENTEIRTGSGKDRVVVDENVTAGVNVNGGAGRDVIIGGSGNDRLSGGNGNDIILGRKGNDTLMGEEGRDLLMGGKGHDKLDGGRGRDANIGGQGFDYIKFDRADLNSKKK